MFESGVQQGRLGREELHLTGQDLNGGAETGFVESGGFVEGEFGNGDLFFYTLNLYSQCVFSERGAFHLGDGIPESLLCRTEQGVRLCAGRLGGPENRTAAE